jgi:dihydrofolate reductase
MGKIVVFEGVSLDGVMQAPARPDEDRRGGFTHGGWATPYVDPNQGRATMESMSTIGAILLGRRTFEDFYAVWHGRTDANPFTPVLDNSPKYVASTTLKEPLVWMNSTLLKGDVAGAVAKLKAQADWDRGVVSSAMARRSPRSGSSIPRRQLPAW